MIVPTYRSKKWIKENWRVLFIKNNEIVIGDQCSEKNHLTDDKKERLCLPLWVIQRMIKTKKNRDIIKKTIRKKLLSEKKIPLHSEINRYIGLFYKGAFNRRPQKIKVYVKNNKLLKSRKRGIKIDKDLFEVLSKDKELKPKLIRYCKQHATYKTR
jgi:hypothetical protein